MLPGNRGLCSTITRDKDVSILYYVEAFVIGHNLFGSLSFGHSDHGDRWPRLRAWEEEGVLFPDNTTSCATWLCELRLP